MHISICISHYGYFVVYSVHLFFTRWSFAIDLFSNILFQTFGYFLKTLTYYVVDFTVLTYLSFRFKYIFKFKFWETFTVMHSVISILLTETLVKFRTIEGAKKSYFMHYQHASLHAFSTYSFKKLTFQFSLFSELLSVFSILSLKGTWGENFTPVFDIFVFLILRGKNIVYYKIMRWFYQISIS